MKINHHFSRYIFQVFLLFCLSLGFAQTPAPQQEYYDKDMNTRSFSRSDWQEIQKNLDYQEKTGGHPGAARQEQEESKAENLIATIIKFIIVIGAILALTLLLRNITGFSRTTLKTSPASPSTATGMELQDFAEKSPESNKLQSLIGEAVLHHDWRMATRWHYLKILRALRARGIISWKKEKTNQDYIDEVQHAGLYPDFLLLTRTFERIWYGRKNMHQEQYTEVAKKFRSLEKKINEHSPG